MHGTETHENRQRHGNEFMIGLLCGTAVGAALGLLLAPKTGAELRHQLAWSADRLRTRATDTYDRASGAMRDAVGRGRDAVDQAWSKGREAAMRGREAFDEAMERGQDLMEDARTAADPDRPSFTS